MKFQKTTKAIAVTAVAISATLVSFHASAAIIIGKRTATSPKQGAFVKLPGSVNAGMTITLPGAVPTTVVTIITTVNAPTPVVIVGPITPSAANKTLAITI